jgi:hypothetical protein
MVRRIGQATDGTIIWHMGVARWINKARGTHSDQVILVFHRNTRYARVSQCYIYTYIASLFQICLVTVALPAGTFMLLPHLSTTGRLGRRRR